MTADDLRAAIAGIKAEDKAVLVALGDIQASPSFLHSAEDHRTFDNLMARHVALASQREDLERRLAERPDNNSPANAFTGMAGAIIDNGRTDMR